VYKLLQVYYTSFRFEIETAETTDEWRLYQFQPHVSYAMYNNIDRVRYMEHSLFVKFLSHDIFPSDSAFELEHIFYILHSFGK
jgi:hypothetical protein